MQNLAPIRSFARRTRQLLLIAFIAASAGIFLAVIGAFLLVVPFAATGTIGATVQQVGGVSLVVLGVAGFLAGIGVALRAITRRAENDLAMQTAQTLGNVLDERYTFIRNINRPQLGYIDAVLVGPPGVLVFRLMGVTGEYLNEKGGWVYKNRRNEWVVWMLDPTKEAIVDVRAVREFLQKHGLNDLDVFGVVAFTQTPPAVKVFVENPIVPVGYLNGLVEVLKPNYLLKERMDDATVQQVTRLLLGDD